MKIYVVHNVLDNPFFEGLAMPSGDNQFETWPADWRKNYLSWEPKKLKQSWRIPTLLGNVRSFNDYPCINLGIPAFSQRAVDLLGDVLESNGELLPVRHEIGTYYFYNCTRMTNCVDLDRSMTTKLKDGLVTNVKKLVFVNELLDGLTIFKVRTQLMELFCSQLFVDRVEATRLEGFSFIPIWPLPEGSTFYEQMNQAISDTKKRRPRQVSDVDIKINTLVLRLYCEKKQPSKVELDSANAIIERLNGLLYNPDQDFTDQYFGNLEGNEITSFEIRIFLSTPDCDRLVSFLAPMLRSLHWPGGFHVVKRRGEYVDASAAQEYVRL